MKNDQYSEGYKLTLNVEWLKTYPREVFLKAMADAYDSALKCDKPFLQSSYLLISHNYKKETEKDK